MQSLSFYHGVLPFQLRDVKNLLRQELSQLSALTLCPNIYIAILVDDVIFGKQISVSVKCFF